MAAGEFASHALVDELAALTGLIRREISVYIGRDGAVEDVSIGDSGKVNMPNMRLVRNADRLSGVRCVHTHPSGDGRLSGVDLGTLRSMRLDAMAALGVNEAGEARHFMQPSWARCGRRSARCLWLGRSGLTACRSAS